MTANQLDFNYMSDPDVIKLYYLKKNNENEKKKKNFEQTIEVLTAEKNANGSKLEHINAKFNRIKKFKKQSKTIKKK